MESRAVALLITSRTNLILLVHSSLRQSLCVFNVIERSTPNSVVFQSGTILPHEEWEMRIGG